MYPALHALAGNSACAGAPWAAARFMLQYIERLIVTELKFCRYAVIFLDTGHCIKRRCQAESHAFWRNSLKLKNAGLGGILKIVTIKGAGHRLGGKPGRRAAGGKTY